MKMIRWAAAGVCLPLNAMADPLDRGDFFSARQGSSDWLDQVDFGPALLNYGLSVLLLIGLGWILFKRPHFFLRLESIIRRPFGAILAASLRASTAASVCLQLLLAFLVLVSLAAWALLCLWLGSKGFEILTVTGLALLAIMLVRLVKGEEKGT
jgi:hypothetical protein